MQYYTIIDRNKRLVNYKLPVQGIFADRRALAKKYSYRLFFIEKKTKKSYTVTVNHIYACPSPSRHLLWATFISLSLVFIAPLKTTFVAVIVGAIILESKHREETKMSKKFNNSKHYENTDTIRTI